MFSAPSSCGRFQLKVESSSPRRSLDTDVAKYQGSRGHLLDLIDRPNWRDELNGILGSVRARISAGSVHIPVGSMQVDEWGLAKFCREHCRPAMDVERFFNKLKQQLYAVENLWVQFPNFH